MDSPLTRSTDNPVQQPMDLAQRALLLGIASVGLVLGLVRVAMVGLGPDIVLLGAATLCTYAAIVALAWFPQPWLSRRVEALCEKFVGNGRAGWYVVVAVAHFMLAELGSAIEQWHEWRSVEDAVRDSVLSHLIGFSTSSFMNSIWASIWPVKVLEQVGMRGLLVFAGLAWGLWTLGRQVFGETPLDRPTADAATDSEDAGSTRTSG